jgi:hypothetical protein
MYGKTKVMLRALAAHNIQCMEKKNNEQTFYSVHICSSRD